MTAAALTIADSYPLGFPFFVQSLTPSILTHVLIIPYRSHNDAHQVLVVASSPQYVDTLAGLTSLHAFPPFSLSLSSTYPVHSFSSTTSLWIRDIVGPYWRTRVTYDFPLATPSATPLDVLSLVPRGRGGASVSCPLAASFALAVTQSLQSSCSIQCSNHLIALFFPSLLF